MNLLWYFYKNIILDGLRHCLLNAEPVRLFFHFIFLMSSAFIYKHFFCGAVSAEMPVELMRITVIIYLFSLVWYFAGVAAVKQFYREKKNLKLFSFTIDRLCRI